MSGAVELKPIHKVRKKNLRKLIESRFDGNTSACARSIKKSNTFMWQLVNGYRSIGEDSARHIEAQLELEERALDQDKPRATTKFPITQANGHTAMYRTVPLRRLEALKVRPAETVPMPLPGIGGAKLFASDVDGEELVEIEDGDRIFVDPEDRQLVPRKLYVVQMKGRRSAMVVVLRKTAHGLRFATNRSKDMEYLAKIDQVIGRVLLIIRRIPR